MKVKIALCLLTALVLTGCSNNCSKTMGAVSCVWGNEEAKHVKIVFMGDKAVTFSYDGLE